MKAKRRRSIPGDLLYEASRVRDYLGDYRPSDSPSYKVVHSKIRGKGSKPMSVALCEICYRAAVQRSPDQRVQLDSIQRCTYRASNGPYKWFDDNWDRPFSFHDGTGFVEKPLGEIVSEFIQIFEDQSIIVLSLPGSPSETHQYQKSSKQKGPRIHRKKLNNLNVEQTAEEASGTEEEEDALSDLPVVPSERDKDELLQSQGPGLPNDDVLTETPENEAEPVPDVDDFPDDDVLACFNLLNDWEEGFDQSS
jgi:hypothetical protein